MSLFKPSGRRRLKDNSNFTPVNKKLNFNLDDSDLEVLKTRDTGSLLDQPQFDMELDEFQLEESENFSPCRTRSGCVYESGRKKRKFRTFSKSTKKSLDGRTRSSSGQSGTGSVADCSENGSENSDDNIGKMLK